jgi:hypothetical protein
MTADATSSCAGLQRVQQLQTEDVHRALGLEDLIRRKLGARGGCGGKQQHRAGTACGRRLHSSPALVFFARSRAAALLSSARRRRRRRRAQLHGGLAREIAPLDAACRGLAMAHLRWAPLNWMRLRIGNWCRGDGVRAPSVSAFSGRDLLSAPPIVEARGRRRPRPFNARCMGCRVLLDCVVCAGRGLLSARRDGDSR